MFGNIATRLYPASSGSLMNAPPVEHVDKPSPQTIHVQTTQNPVSIAIPGLSHYGQNYQSREHVRYGLLSYDFPSDAHNVKKGERIFMQVEISLVPSVNGNNTQSGMFPVTIACPLYNSTGTGYDGSLGFPITFQEDAAYTAVSFADFVFRELIELSFLTNTLCYELTGGNGPWNGLIDAADQHIVELRLFLQNLVSFTFDSSSQKYVMSMQGINLTCLESSDVQYSGYSLVQFRVAFRPDPQLTDFRQRSLARLLGCNPDEKVNVQVNANQLISCYESLYTLGRSYVDLPTSDQPTAIQSSIFASLRQVESGMQFASAPQFFDGATVVIRAFSHSIPRIYPCDYVQIHTTCSTGEWMPLSGTGSKTDMIAQVPYGATFGESNTWYKSVNVNVETLAVLDTVQSLKNFQLTLTDNLGNVLQFNKDYILRLVIFFE